MSIKVDLKSQEVKRGIGFDFSWIIIIVLIVVAFGGFYTYGIRLEDKIREADAKVADVDKEIERYAKIRPAIERLQREVGEIQGQLNQLKELHYDPLKYRILIVELGRLVPPNVWLDNLDIDPGKQLISFSAVAVSQSGAPPLKTIADFIKSLQASQYFYDIRLASTTESKADGRLAFSFHLTTNYRISIVEMKGGEGQ